MAMSDYSLSDIAAITEGGGNGNRGNGGWGGDGWWILLLFILLGGNRGWGNGFGGGSNGGYGAGNVGGNELYPWMELQGNINNGFHNLSTQLCNCCNDMGNTVQQGFFNAETAANARQMANMQQGFANQTAMMQGFNQLGSQFADCCCENRLGIANLNSTILSENCADRAALSDGVRDIIASQTAGTQRILDQMCQDKIDEKNDEIQQLRQQLNMQNLAASQQAQNAFITQGFANEVDALYNRLNNCPVPSMPVYGRTPIFQCQPQQNSCGCGCGGN